MEKENKSFDVWKCRFHGEFKRNIKFNKSRPRCPKCKTTRLSYMGQVSR